MALVVPQVDTRGQKFGEVIVHTPENFVHFTTALTYPGCVEMAHSIREISKRMDDLWREVEVYADANENMWLKQDKEKEKPGVRELRSALFRSFPKYKIKSGKDLCWLVRADLLHKLTEVAPPVIFDFVIPWTECWNIDTESWERT